jgi:hypothetical protein
MVLLRLWMHTDWTRAPEVPPWNCRVRVSTSFGTIPKQRGRVEHRPGEQGQSARL